MILALGAGTFMLREAATGAGDRRRSKGYAGDYGPAIEAWLDTPGGIAVAPNGDVYIADSNNHVIRRIDRARRTSSRSSATTSSGTGFSGDYGPATAAQLDTPDGVAIAPDGDLIVADSHNQRIRRVDRQTGVITTIAGSGESGYDGDDQPAVEAALNTPSAVAAAPNGDIYIADTLNYRVRMIDAKTGLIHTVAGDGTRRRRTATVGDGGPATSAHLNMPSDVAIDPQTGDLYIADMHHNRVRKVDARTHIITTVAGSGAWGYAGDGGPATTARLAGPAGVAVVPRAGRQGDDLHRRLLQRPRPRGRARRHHPRRERRGARGVRRADARRLRRRRARLAVRRRLEPGPGRAAHHSANRAEPGAGAAAAPAPAAARRVGG